MPYKNREEGRRHRKAYYKENRKAIIVSVAAWKKAHHKQYLNARLLSEYGITLERYEEMEGRQKGLCAICGKPQDPKARGTRLYPDHDHRTGKSRELLCCYCNSLLGFAREDLAILNGAIEYLRKHATTAA